MKNSIKIMAAAGFVLPVLYLGTAYAVDSTASGSSTGTNTNTTKTSTTSGTTTTLSAQEKQDLNKRLQNRVAEMKTKLTTAQQDRIVTKCKSAQGVITSVGKKADSVQTTHTQAYGAIIAHLSTLSDKLKARGSDTTTLQSEIDALKTKIATYNTDVTAYKQAVTDLSTMSCTQDPTSFQASLDAARAALNTVRTDAVAIHDYVKNTIRPTLDTIKKQIDQSSSSSSTTTSKTTSGSN